MSASPLVRPAPVIRTRSIGKTYERGSLAVEALRGVDLEIEAGERVAIVGASGSGKTTLLEILGCLSRPSYGDYWLDGVSVAELDPRTMARTRRERIGFVFQAFNLLPRLSALENVELPLVYGSVSARRRRRRALAALDRVGLGERASHLPGELSGGEQQRVAIARAIINEPKLILADEPTGNLDTKNSDIVLAMLRQLNRELGQTIVMITHNPEAAAYTDRVVHMRDGVIVDGVPAD